MRVTKEYRLAYTQKAKNIVDKMSLEEKVYLMSGNTTLLDVFQEKIRNVRYSERPCEAGGNEKYHIPSIKFSDGPRGVTSGNGKSTCFPVSMNRGASFDPELEEEIGKAVGKEIRAYGGNFYGGVCVNLPYHPGWGRSQETYGEDSFALGEFGAALVRGVQSEYVMACVKHYAFNSMENSRFKVSVECDRRTEREVFLPHFRKCVDEDAACVMSAYNKYKGVFCGHHDYLLNKVLKEEWDFDGFVMSDFLAGIRDTVEAANGGMNVEMRDDKFFGEKLVKAVQEGLVSEKKIDDAVLRIVRTILAFEEAYEKYGTKYPETVIGCGEHRKLALRAAQEGIVLLQNKNNVLPFGKDKVKKVAVLGRLGDTENIGDHGSSRVYPPYVITPYQGIQNLLPEHEVVFEDGSDMEKAKQLAKEADAVVYVVGYDHNDEGEHVSGNDVKEMALDYLKNNSGMLKAASGLLTAGQAAQGFEGEEGGDRVKGLGLCGEDVRLIRETDALNPNTAVVLIGGNTTLISEWKDEVSAVLAAFYPGQEGGTAIAQILFGEVNPSGKLPFVLPYEEKDLPAVKWDTTNQYYEYYHGYAKLEKEGVKPLLPYGFGMSYTTFDLTDAEFSSDETEISAKCRVKNTGNLTGTEVVQMYIGFKQSKIDRPVKLLRGFQRVRLAPGEEKEVRITCPWEAAEYYDERQAKFVLEDIDYEVYIGTSADNQDLMMGHVHR